MANFFTLLFYTDKGYLVPIALEIVKFFQRGYNYENDQLKNFLVQLQWQNPLHNQHGNRLNNRWLFVNTSFGKFYYEQ